MSDDERLGEVCSSCEGTGWDEGEGVCFFCDGTGWIE